MNESQRKLMQSIGFKGGPISDDIRGKVMEKFPGSINRPHDDSHMNAFIADVLPVA